MANCSNCYSGCVEIQSDKCVQYTGVDVPILGIKKGDSLSYVEQALITFLTSALDGSGITITIDNANYCNLVSQYLQECSTVTALDLFKALVQAACDLQDQITAEKARIDTLEGDYTIGCLTGVTASSNTHDIVQAVITKLCALDSSLTALALDLDTNYVKLADLNDLIQAYLGSIASTNKAYTKMVPYTVVEYYGSLSNYPAAGDSFDVSGAGQNYWENVYLCNGNNGTPDKRGRSPIGAIVGMGGGALDAEVDPGVSAFSQNYEISGANAKNGVNHITLTESQIPSHTHTLNQTAHNHYTVNANGTGTSNTSTLNASLPIAEYKDNSQSNGYILTGSTLGQADEGPSSSTTIDISAQNTGGSNAHSNTHPVLACYYIMYLP